MSPLIINSGIGTNNNNIPAAVTRTRLQQQNVQQEPATDVKNEDDEEAREERKATGRSIAIIVFLLLMCLALYHVVQKKTTILAGVLVPAMILFSYTFFVIHISQKDKKKRRKQLDSVNDPELSVSSVGPDKTPSIPNPSISSAGTIPSTSGLNAARPLTKIVDPRLAALRAANLHKPLTHKSSSSSLQQCDMGPQSVSDRKKPFKKAQSQSHIQLVSKSAGTNLSGNIQPSAAQFAIQHETKKLKKSRSFDKNNYPMDVQQKHHKKSHVTDNKRPKQQQSSNKV